MVGRQPAPPGAAAAAIVDPLVWSQAQALPAAASRLILYRGLESPSGCRSRFRLAPALRPGSIIRP